MNLWSSLRGSGKPTAEKRHTVDDYLSWFTYGGVQYPVVGSTSNTDREKIESSFVGYVRSAYKSSGPVFACMLARLMIFGEARFQFQRLRNGRPTDLFGTEALSLLEKPWPNGTTGELLARMIQDADLAGNFYAVRETERLRRLRPDWVEIVLTAPPAEAVHSDVAGYLYRPGGTGSATEPVLYLPEQICHWSPIPDPEAQYRGMSWLTPVLREIEADGAATEHKRAFFRNNATPGITVSFKESVTLEQFQEFVTAFNTAHQGTWNAYKPLFLGGGADVTAVGADLRQLDFKATQGAGETRIAAASGVHPVIVGLSEGMQGSSLNAGNFGSARRLTADKTMRPLWRSACAALESVVPPPSGTRLWYVDRDIAFLREDAKDAAEIFHIKSNSTRTLTDAGFEPETIISAVENEDLTLLKHTGLFSVQLQPPNSAQTSTEEPRSMTVTDPALFERLVRDGWALVDTTTRTEPVPS